MSAPLPAWPATPPSHDGVVLRRVREDDAAMARELATDPYVPTIGSLPADAGREDALDWVRRQQERHASGAGFSFTIADAATDAALGHCGLWLRELPEGRATAGYSVAPSSRGKGHAAAALTALTAFGWTVPGLFRIALYIEPWNVASIRTAERAGYAREGLLRSHQVIDGRRRDMALYAAVRL
ncbi:RimJ/RimL family protein N-acetyltransferase [Stackebrandtia albiflava]|uniref:RimJ/RimL family protein N-acetyltransferase n=1 Tax=Stackebrandtia albiflava TaxID=406432 RepID=A0A562VAJ8_9ACTN|nr:GNAT family protein [Stackebrandtia albiflava]TWJ14902.1 RimJ/RimL family protein N-acetyltransferase [Stackebrandtia albiflava]